MVETASGYVRRYHPTCFWSLWLPTLDLRGVARMSIGRYCGFGSRVFRNQTLDAFLVAMQGLGILPLAVTDAYIEIRGYANPAT